jgi:hypothetical protein
MLHNLTKENFFNALRTKCPEAVDEFCKWIDEYKKDNNWVKLFGPDIKFHDLPFEMQQGIIARFELEMGYNFDGNSVQIYRSIAESRKHAIKHLFVSRQYRLIHRKSKLN